MLKWMFGLTRMDWIRNQEVRDRLGVAPLSAKLHGNRLRWFGYVKSNDTPVRMLESLIVECKRSRGRGTIKN